EGGGRILGVEPFHDTAEVVRDKTNALALPIDLLQQRSGGGKDLMDGCPARIGQADQVAAVVVGPRPGPAQWVHCANQPVRTVIFTPPNSARWVRQRQRQVVFVVGELVLAPRGVNGLITAPLCVEGIASGGTAGRDPGDDAAVIVIFGLPFGPQRVYFADDL